MQLLQCDRCKKTESGHMRNGIASIGGWDEVKIGNFTESLLCKACIEKLKLWLCGKDKPARAGAN